MSLSLRHEKPKQIIQRCVDINSLSNRLKPWQHGYIILKKLKLNKTTFVRAINNSKFTLPDINSFIKELMLAHQLVDRCS